MTVYDAVKKAITGKWRMSHEIRSIVNMTTGEFYSESGISARVRDLRKPKYGSHQVECRCITLDGKRHYEYKLANVAARRQA